MDDVRYGSEKTGVCSLWLDWGALVSRCSLACVLSVLMKRRTFVLGSLSAVGLLAVGWAVLPPRQRLVGRRPLPTHGSQKAFNGWVKIDSLGRVTVMMGKSEMGQGIHTGLAMVLAEELDADWAQISLETSPLDTILNNIGVIDAGPPVNPEDHGPLQRVSAHLGAKVMREFGVMMTGGSSSMRDLWLPMRRAGAAARSMLIMAAAQRWGVSATEIKVERGVISHASGQRAGFGDLVAAAAGLPLPMDPPLKDPANFTLIGQPLPRLDATRKSTGQERFAMDIRPAGLLQASVVMCPHLGGTVLHHDAAAARAVPGVRQVVLVGAHAGGTAGIAVIADNTWQALQGVQALRIDWSPGEAAGLSSAGVAKALHAALSSDDRDVFLDRGEVGAAMLTAARTVTADYWAPYLAHSTLEPANCTVQFEAGRAMVWAPTQVPGLARGAVAKVLGIDAEQVELQQTPLGGAFGRRLDVDFIAQAAEVAKHTNGRPVQLVWSREQDLQHDFYRPACASRFRAGLDAAGRVLAWENTSAGQAITPQYMPRALGLPVNSADKTAGEGSFDQAYEFPSALVAHVRVSLPVPVGYWRSVGHSHQGFFIESFIDEVAHAAGQDPLGYRAALLARHPRQLRVLQRVAALARWDQPLGLTVAGAKTGRGVALHQCFGTVVAQVAEVSVAADGRIRVHRVVCVIDCGLPVNPQLIRQQVEGSVVFALSAALYGEITLEDGCVKQSNFHDAPLLRLHESPEVVVDILPSEEAPQGVGEPAVPPLAPAVANAVFAATGVRLRALPLRFSDQTMIAAGGHFGTGV